MRADKLKELKSIIEEYKTIGLEKVEKKDSDIIVVFKNYGVTIPAEQLSTIFEKFNRLDSARASNTGGAGLGLSIAKEIINLHGGKIIAKSSNETIVFIITLPCSS